MLNSVLGLGINSVLHSAGGPQAVLEGHAGQLRQLPCSETKESSEYIRRTINQPTG
jgi:hypothetical protein